MGLLDDAIREHLDLKRRRGADPSEVERLEREALGPMRRSPQMTEEAVLDHQPAESAPYTEESDEGWHEPLDQEHVPENGAESADHEDWELEEPLVAEQTHPAPEPPVPAEPFASDEALRDDKPEWDHDPMAPSQPRRAPATPPLTEQPGQETVEYDVESEGAEDEPEGEDVLEETPEFLQDTPDHDRLWFEQRPPRDFDFDG